jgi:predicted membrane-bound spermidine synthase
MRKYLFVAVFFSGMTSLAVEFAAARLLGNYFGTSNLVWASIIGLILIYLTVGYFLGGRLADRFPNFRTFYTLLCWGAFAVGLIPLVSRPVLRLASQAFDQLSIGVLAGSFIGVLILFSIPVTLLGTASPFAIRLALDDPKQTGKVAGRIYAISTLGSFLGTFIPTLILIPLIGTYRTFLTFSFILLIISLIGIWRSVNFKSALIYIWMPVIIILLFIIGVRGTDKKAAGLIYETDSAYNYIQVQKVNDTFLLRLNEGQGVHSVYNPGTLVTNGPWEQVLVAPFFNSAGILPSNIKSMAIVGLAAGTTARQATAVFPDIKIDGFEIDPKIVDVARKYFDMNEPNLNVLVQDGRTGLENSSNSYQIISIDAYRPPYIPPHLTTQEFFQIVRNHLTEDGAMVINVGRSPTDRELVNALYNTIRSVFPSVYVMDIPNTMNSILYATVQLTVVENLFKNYDLLLQNGSTHPLLILAMRITIENLQPNPALDPKLVFTDDRSPIEWITNKMVVGFVLSSQVETLK